MHLVRPDVPQELAAVVSKMMAKDPAERYQTPVEVAQALVPFVKPKAKTESGKPPPVETKTPALGPGGKSIGKRQPSAVDTGIPVGRDTLTESKMSSAKSGKSAASRRSRSLAVEPAAARYRRWPILVAVGTTLAALALAAVIIKMKVKTADGEAILVLEVDPPGAEVIVDGPQKITVNIPDDKPVEIEVKPGEYNLRISKQGFLAKTQSIELNAGKSPIKIRLEKPPNVVPGPRPNVRPKSDKPEPAPANPAADDQGFKPLFNGEDLKGWKVNEGGNQAVWGAENGILFVNGKGGGWLMTEKEYADSELRLEFKVPERGNSGVCSAVP